MRTLREFLTQRKSVIQRNTTNRRNTLHNVWPKVQDSAPIWNEFNLQTLNDSYGHVLDAPIPEVTLNKEFRGLSPNQILPNFAIDKDSDINHIISWNETIMKPTVEFGKSCLALHNGIVLKYDSTTADKSLRAKFSEKPRFSVDHIIRLDSFPEQKLVVGIGKTSAKWSGIEFLSQPNENLSRPVRQLAEACRLAKTRYGYIQTDEETVVRYFKVNSIKKYEVVMMPIPWSSYGEEILTTDLALWWLSMLALSGPENVALVPEGQVVPINQWEDDWTFDKEFNMVDVKKHTYSQFLRPVQRDNEDTNVFDGIS